MACCPRNVLLIEGRLPETCRGRSGMRRLLLRLVTAAPGGPGTRPGGTTTPPRGARWTGPSRASLGPERFQVLSLGAEDPRKEGTWTWKRGPGIRNRRQWSAERRLPPIARGKDTPRKRVGRFSPSRSRGLANPCVSRRSAPLRGALNETTASRSAKNTGDDACLDQMTYRPLPHRPLAEPAR